MYKLISQKLIIQKIVFPSNLIGYSKINFSISQLKCSKGNQFWEISFDEINL